jgi:cytochrome c6
VRLVFIALTQSRLESSSRRAFRFESTRNIPQSLTKGLLTDQKELAILEVCCERRDTVMKRLIAIALLLITSITFLFSRPALADVDSGAKIFGANCAACHMGGKNMVNAQKTLQKADLEKYSMTSIDAIKTQVTNGKAAMPSFKGRLTDEQIADVASYVLDQAEKGW